jgi:iron complex outermembrane receptor protein
VYQNGSRVNEAFGDVAQWDTIPQFAIDSIQLIPGSNPPFGLNALGGARSVGMKNGFDFQGNEAEAYAARSAAAG